MTEDTKTPKRRSKPATPEFIPEAVAPEPAPEEGRISGDKITPEESPVPVESLPDAGYPWQELPAHTPPAVPEVPLTVLPRESPPPGTPEHAAIVEQATSGPEPLWFGQVALFPDIEHEGGVVLVLIDGRTGQTIEKPIPAAMVKMATGSMFRKIFGGLDK